MFDAYQMVTDRICELMEQGFIPWEKPWATAKTVAWSGNDGHQYSLLNQFLLADPDKKYTDISDLFNDIAGEWVTFKQAQARGGCVKKGEKGRKVVFFKMVQKKDENGEPVRDAKGHIATYPCLSVFTVFKVSQCDGLEQKFHTDADTLYDFNADATADDVADSYVQREGIKLTKRKSNEAYYSPLFDEVVVPLPQQFKNPGEYYSTLFHELVHSTGHSKRLDRITAVSSFGKEEYSLEELVAEIGSASLLATLGVENERTFKNSAAYLQNWLKALRNDKKMIVKAAAQAEKAIKLILNIKEGEKDVA